MATVVIGGSAGQHLEGEVPAPALSEREREPQAREHVHELDQDVGDPVQRVLRRLVSPLSGVVTRP
jgi:hypothetical protein